MSERSLRIALLTHSVNPRGGVVHCLSLGEALMARGHAVTIHAPAAAGSRFFRPTSCATRFVPCEVAPASLSAVVEARIRGFVDWFSQPGHAEFDVFHAHDGIGANALLALRQAGAVPGYLRTVHHLETSFGDAQVDAWEARCIDHADRLLTVSPTWQNKLRHHFGRASTVVGNGVDLSRFNPQPTEMDIRLRHRLGLGRGPIFLMVGGIEARKNTIGALRAFARLKRGVPDAQLLIVGGASLLDHDRYRKDFDAALAQAGLTAGVEVILAGVLADDEMPAAYRLADALVFASLIEGFGLAIIEAMACGVPTLVSNMAPFTDFLDDTDSLWVDPHDPDSIATAMCRALIPATRQQLIEAGHEVAARHQWDGCARAHEAAYLDLLKTTTPRTEFHHA
jgi:glycosyltransferase-like protein